MSANDDLLEILKEALERAGDVSGRRMFGGIGVYFDATFFALIDDGAIYFKTSDATRAMFEAEGSRPFSYMTKKGLAELRSYWRLPERLLDETDELRIGRARRLQLRVRLPERWRRNLPLRGPKQRHCRKPNQRRGDAGWLPILGFATIGGLPLPEGRGLSSQLRPGTFIGRGGLRMNAGMFSAKPNRSPPFCGAGAF